MNSRRALGLSFLLLSLLVLALAPGTGAQVLSGPGPIGGTFLHASELQARSDSLALHRRARDAQDRFERLRARESSFTWWSGGGSSCDEIVGRLCIRSSRDDDTEGFQDRGTHWTPRPDSPELTEARGDLLDVLAEAAAEHPGDAWVAGQQVAYLIESGMASRALESAERCRAEIWWCAALTGYALHELARFADAESAFETALASMPEATRTLWLDPSWLVEPSDRGRLGFGAADGEAQPAARRFWALANPLLLLDGNPLRTAHFSRHVLARVRSDARNIHALRWGDDLTQLMIRYGPVIAFQQEVATGPSRPMAPPSIVGHYTPHARGLLPSREALLAPVESGADRWRTHLRAVHSRHAVPGIERIIRMDAQVARLPLGDSVLLVAAWQVPAPLPATPPPEGGPWASTEGPPPFPPPNLRAGAVLMDVSAAGSGEVREVARTELALDGERGSLTLPAPLGAMLVSIEVIDPDGAQAWRYRSGIVLEKSVLSDFLLLAPPIGSEVDESSGAEPVTLEALLARMLPGNRVPAGRIEMAWAVEGLTGDEESLRYRLTLEREDVGILRRAGQFLRLVRPEHPLDIRWDEGVELRPPSPDGFPNLRRITLDLSAVEPGTLLMSLSLTRPGWPPVVWSRSIEVHPEPGTDATSHR